MWPVECPCGRSLRWSFVSPVLLVGRVRRGFRRRVFFLHPTFHCRRNWDSRYVVDSAFHPVQVVWSSVVVRGPRRGHYNCALGSIQ